jgi:hypothetical protein
VYDIPGIKENKRLEQANNLPIFKFLTFSDQGSWNTREAFDILQKFEKSDHVP